MHNNELMDKIADYYSNKLDVFGTTPKGVDWKDAESHILRFKQFSNLFDDKEFFSLIDLGCGYGAYFEYLQERFNNFIYHGYDVSQSMIITAQEKLKSFSNAFFYIESNPKIKTDYVVASGIFNVKLDEINDDWLNYIYKTLELINSVSIKGFAFNCLTSYSDLDKMRDYLYYANPGSMFDFCKRNFSKNVSLLHDYNLHEFTILVRK